MATPFSLAVASIVLATGVAAQHTVFASPIAEQLAQQRPLIQRIERNNPQLSESAFLSGIKAYDHLRSMGKDQQQILTIVNFDRPSNEKRLWVIDMHKARVNYFTYVAQGQNTGLNVAKHFSNRLNTHESSIGVYLTGNTYSGVDGHSMRLHGLDKGFNNNAFKRHIVMHPAWYVSEQFAKTYGRIGRTYGCFGLNKQLAKKIIPTIQNGTVLVAYHNDPRWFAQSRFEQPLMA